MDNHEYYYLDGIDKKGPFTKDEIIAKNLSPSTLIYFDGLSNWQPISQTEDLNQPVVVVEEVVNSYIDEKNDDKKTGIPNKIKVSSFLVAIIFLALTTFLSYLYTNNQKEADLKKIESEINDVFDGKEEICDFESSGVSGGFQALDLFTPNDNEGKRLVEYYNCKNGGWTVFTLKRLNNGFDYTETYSTDMGFKKPESTYTPGKDYGFGIRSESYRQPTFRGSVQNAYNQALYFLTKENDKGSYLPNSYLKIKTFQEINSDYYKMSNVEPTKYSEGSVDAKSWTNSGSVYNVDWIVWYKINGKHLEIVEDNEKFNKVWLKYSIISGILAIVILFALKYREKIALQF